MDDRLVGFFDELEKIGAIAHSISGSASGVPAKPSEVRQPMTPSQIKPKAINPSTKRGMSTNYTRSNVEAPGTDVSVNMAQKVITPPPVRM